MAYIGKKSHGISASRGIYGLSLLIDMIFTLYFEVSPGISLDPTRWGEVLLEVVGYGPFKPICPVAYGPPLLNPVRASPHFASSRGIPRDGEKFSLRGWGTVL